MNRFAVLIAAVRGGRQKILAPHLQAIDLLSKEAVAAVLGKPQKIKAAAVLRCTPPIPPMRLLARLKARTGANRPELAQ